MPRKIRQLKQDLRRAGFTARPGKGRHVVWGHPWIAEQVTLAGRDGQDARHYQEDELRDALAALARARREREERS